MHTGGHGPSTCMRGASHMGGGGPYAVPPHTSVHQVSNATPFAAVCSLMLLARILGLSKTAIGYESEPTRHKLAIQLAGKALEKLAAAQHIPARWQDMQPFSINRDVTTVRCSTGWLRGPNSNSNNTHVCACVRAQ